MARDQLEMKLGGETGPELFFGLVGAVGTKLHTVSRILSEELALANYDCHEVRLSQLLRECHRFDGLKNLDGGYEDDTIRIDDIKSFILS